MIAHVVVLTVLARHAPMLRMPPSEGGPPEPIIPILIMPRVPPPLAGQPGAPTVIRLHRRKQRFAPPPETPPLYVAPVIEIPAPKVVAAPPPPSPAQAQQTQARTILRKGILGCMNATAAGLSREERERCNDRFATGGTKAPALGLNLNPASGAAFDRQIAEDRARSAPPPVGVTGATGSTASDMLGSMGGR